MLDFKLTYPSTLRLHRRLCSQSTQYHPQSSTRKLPTQPLRQTVKEKKQSRGGASLLLISNRVTQSCRCCAEADVSVSFAKHCRRFVGPHHPMSDQHSPKTIICETAICTSSDLASLTRTFTIHERYLELKVGRAIPIAPTPAWLQPSRDIRQ
jgi:hypothetical protein